MNSSGPGAAGEATGQIDSRPAFRYAQFPAHNRNPVAPLEVLLRRETQAIEFVRWLCCRLGPWETVWRCAPSLPPHCQTPAKTEPS